LTETNQSVDTAQRALVERVLTQCEYGLIPLRFHAEVVDRYRENPHARLLRTRSVGRIAVPGGWSLDVGIGPGEGEVEVFVQDLAERLPAAEREHWIDHLVAIPININFTRMRFTPAACIDDGELERW
jgi:hypothetical protein